MVGKKNDGLSVWTEPRVNKKPTDRDAGEFRPEAVDPGSHDIKRIRNMLEGVLLLLRRRRLVQLCVTRVWDESAGMRGCLLSTS